MVVVDRTKQKLAIFQDDEKIVRPDLNVAKWSGVLFASPWAKDLDKIKVFKYSLPDGGEASITITPAVGRKRPTITTQKVFLALVKIWERNGKCSRGRVLFSARELADVMKIRWAGSDTVERLQEHLSILSGTNFEWEHSYETVDERVTLMEEMHFIENKTYLSREKMRNKEFFYGQHKVRLNDYLVENMLSGKTKPVNFETLISIKHDGGAKLYNLLDAIMNDKPKYERTARGLLIDDLEMSGVRYEKKFARKAKLEELIRAVDGKQLSCGDFLSLSIEETVDKSDWKLVVRKIKNTNKSSPLRLKVINTQAKAEFIADRIIEELQFSGSIDPSKNKKIFTRLALHYNENLLMRVAGNVKVDYQGKIKKSIAKTYMYQVHVLVHEQGKEWIKDCGKTCSYRPKNK